MGACSSRLRGSPSMVSETRGYLEAKPVTSARPSRSRVRGRTPPSSAVDPITDHLFELGVLAECRTALQHHEHRLRGLYPVAASQSPTCTVTLVATRRQ